MDQLLSAYGDSDDEQNSINNQTNNGNNEETVNTRETENTEKNNTIIGNYFFELIDLNSAKFFC